MSCLALWVFTENKRNRKAKEICSDERMNKESLIKRKVTMNTCAWESYCMEKQAAKSVHNEQVSVNKTFTAPSSNYKWTGVHTWTPHLLPNFSFQVPLLSQILLCISKLWQDNQRPFYCEIKCVKQEINHPLLTLGILITEEINAHICEHLDTLN